METEKSLPEHFDILSHDDRQMYLNLQSLISNDGKRSPKNQKTKMLEDNLEQIKKFCIRNDNDDIKRCLVCGIIWVEEGIGINLFQFMKLFKKGKSAINTSLRQLGYQLTQSRCDSSEPLKEHFAPILGLTDLRQWTIRTNSKYYNVDKARKNLHSKPSVLFLKKYNYDVPTTHMKYRPREKSPIKQINQEISQLPEFNFDVDQNQNGTFDLGFMDASINEFMDLSFMF